MCAAPSPIPPPLLDEPDAGTIRSVKGEERVYYDGYWIRRYRVPPSLAYKKALIDSLTRRVFHHAEPGINTPGERLEYVREQHRRESDPLRKRVLAAMLAGALLNRGADILTRLVELEQIGVVVHADNELIKECGLCFMGALEYGRQIRPVRGREGLDELWGEPFKAFTMSVEGYLETRYIKIAQTMGMIDRVTERISEIFHGITVFPEVEERVHELGNCAKLVSETLRSDRRIIEAWPSFVSAADRVRACEGVLPESATRREYTLAQRASKLIREGGDLIVNMANLRVPMPKSTQEYMQRCTAFEEKYLPRLRAYCVQLAHLS